MRKIINHIKSAWYRYGLETLVIIINGILVDLHLTIGIGSRRVLKFYYLLLIPFLLSACYSTRTIYYANNTDDIVTSDKEVRVYQEVKNINISVKGKITSTEGDSITVTKFRKSGINKNYIILKDDIQKITVPNNEVLDLHSRLKSSDIQIDVGVFTFGAAEVNLQYVLTRPLDQTGLLAFHFGAGGTTWDDTGNGSIGIILNPALSYGRKHRFELGADFRLYLYFLPIYWTIIPVKIAYRSMGKKATFRLYFAPISFNMGRYGESTFLIGTSLSLKLNK